jgi:hypothetical protein
MITIEQVRKMALSLPEAEEKMHFHLTGFWIKKKIFATIHADKKYVMVKLSPVEQSVFCLYDKEVIFPVPGGWGKQGATFINLKKIRKSMLQDALTTAWKLAAPSKLRAQYFNKE